MNNMCTVNYLHALFNKCYLNEHMELQITKLLTAVQPGRLQFLVKSSVNSLKLEFSFIPEL